jgi:1,4-dihydroxy-6-naphthoate synthase
MAVQKKVFTLGFSPCPNDTFIFDALVNHKIDTAGLQFEAKLEDVETLNRWALESRLDISKVSYGVWPLIQKNYALLNSGGALGKGVGPLLISKEPVDDIDSRMKELVVALPGEHTTANLLFSMAFPQASQVKYMLFSSIEEAVLNGEVDCGVIIHESRFTYAQKGLHKLMDLGDFWEQQTEVPIPLGGVVMKKEIGMDVMTLVDDLIRRSLEFAFRNYPRLSDYVKIHAQEMDEGVMRQHIDLYVNDFTLDLGPEGRRAIARLTAQRAIKESPLL